MTEDGIDWEALAESKSRKTQKSEKKEFAEVPIPPIEQRIEEYLSQEDFHSASFVIRRVMEHHFRYGLELLKKYHKQLININHPNITQLFKDYLHSSNVVLRHKDIFYAVKVRLDALASEMNLYGPNYWSLLDEYHGAADIPSKIGRDEKYDFQHEIDRWAEEGLKNFLNEIDEYYAQFLRLKEFTFPEAEDQATNEQPEWKTEVLSIVELLAKSKRPLSDWSMYRDYKTWLAVKKIAEHAEEEYPGEYEFDEEELQFRQVIRKEGAPSLYVTKGLFRKSNIYETAFGIDEVTPIKVSSKGILFQAVVDGKEVVLLNKQVWPITLTEIGTAKLVSTEKSVYVLGQQDGKEGIYSQGKLIAEHSWEDWAGDFYTVGSHSVIETGIINEKNGNYSAKVLIDGKPVEINGLIIGTKAFGDLVIITVNKFDKNGGTGLHQTYVFKASSGSLDISTPLQAGVDQVNAKNAVMVGNEIYFFQPDYNRLYHLRSTGYWYDAEPNTHLVYDRNFALMGSSEYPIFTLGNRLVAMVSVNKNDPPRSIEIDSTYEREKNPYYLTSSTHEYYYQKKHILIPNDQTNTGFMLHEIDGSQYETPTHSAFTKQDVVTPQVNITEQTVYILRSNGMKPGFQVNIDGDTILKRDRTWFTGIFYGDEKVVYTTEYDGQHHYCAGGEVLFQSEDPVLMLGYHNGLPLMLGRQIKDAGSVHTVFLGKEIVFQSDDASSLFISGTSPITGEIFDIFTRICHHNDFFCKSKAINDFVDDVTVRVSTFDKTSGDIVDIKPNWKKNRILQAEDDQAQFQNYQMIMNKVLRYKKLAKELAHEESDVRAAFEEPQNYSNGLTRRLLEELKKHFALLIKSGIKGAWSPPNEYQAELMLEALRKNPTFLLDNMTPGLDMKTDELIDEICSLIAPDLFAAAKENKGKKKRNDLVATLKDFLGKPTDTPNLLRKVGDAINALGGEGSEKLRSSTLVGRVRNYSPMGVRDAILYQKDSQSWSTLPKPQPSFEKESGWKRGTDYEVITKGMGGQKSVVLLCQPDGEIDTESVKAVMTFGRKQKLNVRFEQGYAVIDLPVGASKIEYSDYKVPERILRAGWGEYENFKEKFKAVEPEQFEVLSETLPIDPRLMLKVRAARTDDPLETMGNLEKLCRESGIYDLRNEKTETERRQFGVADTLRFAVGRLDDLKNGPLKEKINVNKLYAGVCYESSMLLIAMLRSVGILATLVSEYRPKKEGKFGTGDLHASVCVIWPDAAGSSYSSINLDGTFENIERKEDAPGAAVPFLQRLSSGAATVEEAEVETGKGVSGVNEGKDGGDEEGAKDESVELDETEADKRQENSGVSIVRVVNAGELSKGDILTDVLRTRDAADLKQLYDYAQAMTFGLNNDPERLEFEKLSTPEERLAWLDAKTAEEKITPKRWRNAFSVGDKEVLVQEILLRLAGEEQKA